MRCNRCSGDAHVTMCVLMERGNKIVQDGWHLCNECYAGVESQLVTPPKRVRDQDKFESNKCDKIL
jgi:hypothetical protein